MKINTLALLPLLVLSLLAPEAKAQSQLLYSTDFYTNNLGQTNFTGDTSIAGQDGWRTTSQNPGPGIVRILNYNDGYGTQPNSFALGGNTYGSVFPSDPTTYPNSQYTTINHAASTGVNAVYFSSIFDMAYSSGPTDTFGWNVMSSSGLTLFNVLLTPTTTLGATTYSLGIQSWANDNTSFVTQTLTNTLGNPISAINPNAWYNLGFNISGIGTTNQAISVYSYTPTSTNFVGTTSILYSDFSYNPGYNDGNTNVGYVGLDWILQNTGTDTNGNMTNYGNNTMLVNQFVAAVPEPKSWILLGLSSLIVVVALRRRA